MLREKILQLVTEYHALAHTPSAFTPGITPVPVAGRVYDAADMQHLIDSGLDFWLTTGRFAAQFEKDLAAYIGARTAALVNSGSSANLLALTALTSPKLEERRLRPRASFRRHRGFAPGALFRLKPRRSCPGLGVLHKQRNLTGNSRHGDKRRTPGTFNTS